MHKRPHAYPVFSGKGYFGGVCLEKIFFEKDLERDVSCNANDKFPRIGVFRFILVFMGGGGGGGGVR